MEAITLHFLIRHETELNSSALFELLGNSARGPPERPLDPHYALTTISDSASTGVKRWT